MARHINKLTALSIPRISKKGLHGDGGGLYLRVTKDGGKYWIFRFSKDHRSHEMGLGAVHAVTLADARLKATECRKMLAGGHDPILARETIKAQARLSAARMKTFAECAAAYIDAHKPTWKNEKHIQQWENTLKTYVYPVFGSVHVKDIDVGLVLKAIEPIWKNKTETASRVRGRIEVILDWAASRGYRKGENPARWRGHIENILPKRSKQQRVEHHPAMPYQGVPAFMCRLNAEYSVGSMALKFTILTASRTGEIISATWDEIDFVNNVWTVPPERMKAGRQHRVPLSQEVLDVLSEMAKMQKADKDKLSKWIFPGLGWRKHLSNMAMLALFKGMGYEGYTVHGFRRSFRDWAAEQTNYPREVAEAALAHITGDKVEAAYLRSDFFEKRREMMVAWAKHCQSGKCTDKRRTNEM